MRTRGSRPESELAPDVGEGGPRVLLVTADPGLLDDVLRLAAATSVEVEVARDPVGARRSWSGARGVVVGDDLASSLALRPPPRRDDVLLVCRTEVSASDSASPAPVAWRLGVALGVSHVLVLPDGERWLTGWLADTQERSRGATVGLAPVLAVVGGRGGAGATSLVVGLGRAAARRGASVLLLDLDPCGGGLDLALGAEDVDGLRWPDLVDARGRVSARSLAESTVQHDGVHVLAWGRAGPDRVEPEAVVAVLSAAVRAHDLVVVDLPRHDDPAAAETVSRSSHVLVVVPAEVRAVAATIRLVGFLSRHADELSLVVRGPAPGGLAPTAVAAAVGLPLALDMAGDPRLAAALECARPTSPRGPLAKACGTLVSQWLPGGTGRAA